MKTTTSNRESEPGEGAGDVAGTGADMGADDGAGIAAVLLSTAVVPSAGIAHLGNAACAESFDDESVSRALAAIRAPHEGGVQGGDKQ